MDKSKSSRTKPDKSDPSQFDPERYVMENRGRVSNLLSPRPEKEPEPDSKYGTRPNQCDTDKIDDRVAAATEAQKQLRRAVNNISHLESHFMSNEDIGDYTMLAYQHLTDAAQEITKIGEMMHMAGNVYESERTINNVSVKAIQHGIAFRMPLPLRRTYAHNVKERYFFTNGIYATTRPPEAQNMFGARNTMVFLYIQRKSGTCLRYAFDHDNYVIKPIIDAVCLMFGLSDSGDRLSLVMHSAPSENCGLEPFLYLFLLPGQDGISCSETIDLAKQTWDAEPQPEPQKNGEVPV